MSALDFLQTEMQLGEPAAYKPATFGEVVQSALYAFGQRTGYEAAPVIETAQDYSERDKILSERFAPDELEKIVGTDQDLRDETLRIDAEKGLPFPANYTPDISAVKNQRLDQAIVSGREQDPTRWQGIKTSEELREEKRNRARAAMESYQDIAARATPTSAFTGSLVGGIGAAFTDPINLATLPFGATSSMGILKAMKVEALLNAGVEIAEIPLVSSWQKELGYKYGIGDAVLDVATAGAGGAALTGIIRGARPAFDAMGKFIGSKSQPILQKISTSEKLPTSVREAASYMSRVAHVDENNPIMRNVAEGVETPTRAQDMVLHRQTLQDTQDAFRNYEQPVFNLKDLGFDFRSTEKISEENLLRINKRVEENAFLIEEGRFKSRKEADNYIRDLSKERELKRTDFIVENKNGETVVISANRDLNFLKNEAGEIKQFKNFAEARNEANSIKESGQKAEAISFTPKEKPKQQKRKAEQKFVVIQGATQDQIKRIQQSPQFVQVFEPKRKEDIVEQPLQDVAQDQVTDPSVNKLINDLIFRPNDALASMQRDVETLNSLDADAFRADFERLLKDNPNLEIETETGKLTLSEIKAQIEEDEGILSAIRTCALGRK